MRRTDELDRLVLAAVGDDYVTLECIVDTLGGPNGQIDPELVNNRLLALIAEKLVNACLLHADPPYITPVKISAGTLSSSWFYITQRGRKCLANSKRRSLGEAPTRPIRIGTPPLPGPEPRPGRVRVPRSEYSGPMHG